MSEGLRERIARAIDPEAFERPDEWLDGDEKDFALKAADRVIAREGLREDWGVWFMEPSTETAWFQPTDEETARFLMGEASMSASKELRSRVVSDWRAVE
jgi:hypothetical protein